MVLDIGSDLFKKKVRDFDVSDFLISRSIVSLKNKFISIPASAFQPVDTDADKIDYNNTDGSATMAVNTCEIVAPVILPHGAEMLACIVYGNAGAEGEQYRLRRSKLSDASTNIIFQDPINSEETVVSPAEERIVNNLVYTYHINIENLEIGDKIYGARIRLL
ncbi:hypothetical protein LCGC14_1144540 [marine sediment metagenome]|uniref:Uncharacterized protein n=1 Tax=marine sediment metagenome TaxID=412755 RepID=A0A0F9M262_9ZZZZ